MPQDNRPRGREKNVTGQGKDIYKRGSGLGTGPVGGTARPAGSAGGSSGSSGRRTATRAAGGTGIVAVIAAAAVLLFGNKLGINLGGDGGSTPSVGNSSALTSIASTFAGSNVSTGWTTEANTNQLDSSVAKGARDKYTTIKGNGSDVVTIMVYMCGTDLESKNGMATSDLQEMASAKIGSNVNVLVYTGGCTKWKNNIVSSTNNQIYKIEEGGLKCIVDNDGAKAMTKPDTLASFIKWCSQNYPANRNELILWDHGGGTLSGFGYDEKNKTSGSMNLSGINSALAGGGMKFDFIGFDACLMATLENALMLTDYADYLIASEETEPGVGWYYTNWLTELSKNTSMPTAELGKKIVDDFVTTCAKACGGQKTTLSVVDLAELQATVPDSLSSFATSTTELIQNDEYATVSNARAGAREFATSSKIDQVDLVDLANRIGTAEAKKLVNVIQSAVKYNRTSANMTNSYGLSIYFPQKKGNSVNNAAKLYDAIGMDGDYAKCIQTFTAVQTAGQAATGGTSSPLSSLLGSSGASAAASSSSTSYVGSDALSSLLGSMMGGGSTGGISGFDAGGMSSLLSAFLSTDRTVAYIEDNHIDSSDIQWTEKNGKKVISMSDDKWALVQNLELNVYYDDGEGYIDLGLDNVYDFDDDGNLIGEFDGTWLAINNQPVAYYHMDTVDDGKDYTITGRVPCLLDGTRAELILVFDNDNPYGYIAGYRYIYTDGETDTIAKGTTELEAGTKIDFICDYYAYDGTYLDSYMFGDSMTYNGKAEISNVYIDESKAEPTYRFTDIYNQHFWTETIK